MGRLKNHAIEKRYRWDCAHMKAAWAYASLSFDAHMKVGCIITHEDSVISCGWNGTPPGEPNECKDENGKTLPTVIHAEHNAIDNAPGLLEDCTVYVTLAPCLTCAKSLVAHGIKRVVYSETKCPKGLEYLTKKGVEHECVRVSVWPY